MYKSKKDNLSSRYDREMKNDCYNQNVSSVSSELNCKPNRSVSSYGYTVQSKYDSRATQTSVQEAKEKRCDHSSDDDLMKGSDDAAVNVKKSSKIQTSEHLVQPINRYKILLGTMVSVIVIVLIITLSVTTLILVSKNDSNHGFELKKDISRISNKLDNLSRKMGLNSSTTDGPKTCDKMHASFIYSHFQKENRRLKAALHKTKLRKDNNRMHGFQLTRDISRISNQLDSLSIKITNYSSKTDETQTCENINTSYLYYVLKEENGKLKAELQKTKSRKDAQPNGSQLTKDILRILNQLESISTKSNGYGSRTDGTQQYENINTNGSNTSTEADHKRNHQYSSKEPMQVDRGSVHSINNLQYGWVVGDRSLFFGRSDQFDIIIKLELLYPDVPDSGKILFEFGLANSVDYKLSIKPVIIVRGERCEQKPGICLYVIDNTLTQLEGNVFEQMSDHLQGKITLELHKSYFVLMSKKKNIYISNMLNRSTSMNLWPVFGLYNTHLINISLTIFSENRISYNRSTIDPHLFVSEDSTTISISKLRPTRFGWSFRFWSIETVGFLVSMLISFVLIISACKSR